MEMKNKPRSEMDKKYLWDLSCVFKSDEDWYQALDEVKEMINSYQKYQDTFMDSAKNLYYTLKLDQEVSRKLDLLNVYSNSKSDEDKSNNTYLKMSGELMDVYTKVSVNSSFLVPTLLKYQYLKIEEYMKEEPRLKEFEHSLKDVYRYKPYVLPENEEKLLSEFSKVFQNSSETYDIFTTSDLEFGSVLSDTGEEIELTDANFGYYLRSKNRAFRKRVFEKVYESYKQYSNTIATTLAGVVDTSIIDARIRGYQNSMQSYLFPDEVNSEVYDNVINSINEGLPILMKYFQLKKDVLGLDELHIYDTYVDLAPNNTNKEYTFEEGKELVLDALSVLGEDYIKNLNTAFDSNWIDVFPNKGKHGGAYSGGSYDTPPYVLLNYLGTMNDVSTLAHELGHSMHSYYTRTNNPYETGDYSIFVAEVASTVNELLLGLHLLQVTEDVNEKKSILAHLLDMFKATLYRQTMFAEFEKKIHKDAEEGMILTSDYLCDTYYELAKKYHEPVAIADKEIRYEWERIHHFFTPFYVYKYVTGLASACKIVTDILSEKEQAVEHYMEFLKSGSKQSPVETLKIAGVDILSRETMESAIKLFEQLIEEFRTLENS
ncbi:MAG: oligoendopeptidase F [Firmicutes bacterium]|nr:oligoendopeptidase F [Bacillota bacterium]